MTQRRRARTAAAGALAASALALAPAASAAAARTSGEETAYVRVGHLVPELGEMVMSAVLTDYDGSTQPLELVPEATYGAVTDYAALPVGYYSVSVRPVGAAPDSPPVLSGTLEARAGQAYTVAGLGTAEAPRLGAIQDDITPAAPGTARVRVVPAASAAQQLDVGVVGGPALAEDAAFSQPTGYVDVPAGDVTVRAGAQGGPPSDTPVELGDGDVYTLLVLDAPQGGLEVRAIEDATGAGVQPVGGADTGFGGLAGGQDGGQDGAASAALAAGGGALALAGTGALALQHRRRASASR
ncbi:DUF4397 domain-containing protein [Quadrisphaera sp. DSM 44207]|uniref:DUF4397 domain-containing protein n=1 Tax=Quadrisphaera sp. DSM 44207 TaxID=1881057 RepID=UPI00088272FB|nr:DUF4397 domain-containing protein [Quadrisphaera sp. DSM 44207]SDQ05467.1 protein of unknown function [Quadrisphaera sp. DSM 44207]